MTKEVLVRMKKKTRKKYFVWIEYFIRIEVLFFFLFFLIIKSTLWQSPVMFYGLSCYHHYPVLYITAGTGPELGSFHGTSVSVYFDIIMTRPFCTLQILSFVKIKHI